MNDNEEAYFPEGTVHPDVEKKMGLLDFVWDDAKNQHNIKVHHVDFETAMYVFNDDQRIEIYDEAHSFEENRYNVIGRATEKDWTEAPGTGKNSIDFCPICK